MLKQLIDVFNKYEKRVISVREVPCNRVCNYGIVEAEGFERNIYMVET